MRTSQNPYSVYDLLGYLIPGLLSILGTSLIFDNDFSTGHLTVGFWKSINIDAFSLNHIVPLLIIAYLTGHLLSYLSAMTVEKFSIWSIGYPTEYLLNNLKNKQNKKSLFKFEFLKKYFTPDKKPNFFIYVLRSLLLFLLLPLFLPLSIASLLLNMHITIKKPIDRYLASYSMMKIKIYYKNENFKLKNKQKKKSFFKFEFLKRYFTPDKKPNFFIYVLRVLLLILLLPMILPLSIASLLLNMHITIKKPIDKHLASYSMLKIKSYYKKQDFKLKNKFFDEFEWFRPLSHYVTENYPQHAQKIQNYVALYGFNRNICLMSISFFWILLFKSILEDQFFRRYSLEVIMAFSTNWKEK
jgi:hypothetical protein